MRARHAVTLAITILLSGCAYQAPVPVVAAGDVGQVGDRQPGKYAAFIQTGGWDLKADIKGMGCSFHSYSVDVSPTWEATSRELITGAIERVDFIASVKTPDELKTEGYAGLIIFSPSSAKSELVVVPKFIVSDAVAETTLDALMVINWPNGATRQQSFTGRGRGSKEVFSCSGPEEALGQSAGFAITSILRQAVVTMKLLLAQHRS